MSDPKKPIDPNAATGFAQPAVRPPADPLAATGIAQPAAADPLAATGFAQPAARAPNPHADPLAATGFAQPAAQPHADPLAATGFAYPPQPGPQPPATQAQPLYQPYPHPQPAQPFGHPYPQPPQAQPGPPYAPPPGGAQVASPARSTGKVIAIALVVTGIAAGGAFAITRAMRGSGDTPAKGSAPIAAGSAGSTNGGTATGTAKGGGANNGNANDIGPSGGTGVNGRVTAPAGEATASKVVELQNTVLTDRSRNVVELDHLFATDAFGIGADASEIAIGSDAIVAALQHDLDGARRVELVRQWDGVTGNANWHAATLAVTFADGKRTFALTELVAPGPDHRFTIRALHFARQVGNLVANAAATDHALPTPERIPDHRPDASVAADARLDQELDETVRHAFASHDAYVAALSTRGDAVNFGSAPHEEMEGPKGQAAFRSMRADFALHDGVHVARVAPDVGFGAANVNFTNKAGTQVFRVLVVLVRESETWKIVQAQWSNGLPIPGA